MALLNFGERIDPGIYHHMKIELKKADDEALLSALELSISSVA